jgi:hypothetical protein
MSPKSLDQKEKGRIRIRNRVAENMLRERRQFGERRIPMATRQKKKFNRHDALKQDWKNYDEDV